MQHPVLLEMSLGRMLAEPLKTVTRKRMTEHVMGTMSL